jgi:hypothetical protein
MGFAINRGSLVKRANLASSPKKSLSVGFIPGGSETEGYLQPREQKVDERKSLPTAYAIRVHHILAGQLPPIAASAKRTLAASSTTRPPKLWCHRAG